MKTRLVLLLGGFAAAGVAGRAEVEFAGYMRTAQGEMKFVLADPAAQQTSAWLGIGGSFAGYRVTGFAQKTETLAVEKDGMPRQLPLKNAATPAASPGAAVAAYESPPTEEESAASRESERLFLVLHSHTRLLEALRARLASPRELSAKEHGPAGGPPAERDYLNEEIARVSRQIERDGLARDRHNRILLLKSLRDLGSSNPPLTAEMQGTLREIDARLARAGAPPPAAAPP